jgi:undecaprenyl-phosphate 4-deoxy-4-formamido-L-arabinose transferase
VNISLVVPCYRSAATIPTLVTRIEAAMAALKASGRIDEFELLLVEDASPDNTDKIVRQAAADNANVRALLMRRNFGQHNALVAGIRAAQYGVVVTLDDDLQHPPEEIYRLLDALDDDQVDLVYATPLVEEHGFLRSLASRTVKRGLALAGVANAQMVGAFRAFRTDLREGFANATDSQINLDVVLAWTTSRVVAVRVNMDRRSEGRSSYSFRRLVTHTLNMITGYGVLPLRIATWLGFACSALGVVLLVYVLVRFALGANTVQGFTTLAALISLFAGAQMFTIGVIGEYLGRQHFRSMNRPMYLLREEATDD